MFCLDISFRKMVKVFFKKKKTYRIRKSRQLLLKIINGNMYICLDIYYIIILVSIKNRKTNLQEQEQEH